MTPTKDQTPDLVELVAHMRREAGPVPVVTICEHALSDGADAIESLLSEIQALRQRAEGAEALLVFGANQLGILERRAHAAESQVSALTLEREGLRADALRYRYLREHCSEGYGMTQEQPAELHINWEWQQNRPDERYYDLEAAIDQDIARLDDEDRALLVSPILGGGQGNQEDTESQSQPCTNGALPVLKDAQHSDGGDIRKALGLPPVHPETLRSFGPPLYTEGQVLAYAAAVTADLLAALRGLEPFLDAIVCYASSLDEHEPNRLALNARKAIAKAVQS